VRADPAPELQLFLGQASQFYALGALGVALDIVGAAETAEGRADGFSEEQKLGSYHLLSFIAVELGPTVAGDGAFELDLVSISREVPM